MTTRTIILLIIILIFGSGLRLYGLTRQSLWNDELSSWRRSSYNSLYAVINRGARPDVHPPGYHILLYLVQRYIGDSESILRFPSVVSGTLSIVAIFLVGTSLYSYREGLIASALMAALWCPIYYSQEARVYSTLLLFTMLATHLWISITKNLYKGDLPPDRIIFGYVTTSIVSAYLHYFGFYLIALQGLGAVLFFIRRRQALLYILSAYSLILLAYLPWWPAMLEDLGRETIWIEASQISAFVDYLRFLFNESMALLLIVLMLCSLSFLRNLYNILKTKERESVRTTLLSPALLLILWLTIPFIGVYLKSILSTPVLTFRNLIISLPAAYLLLSRSLTQLFRHPRLQALAAFTLIALFLYNIIFSLNYYTEPHKQQFREAVGYIVERDHLYQNSLVIGYRVKAYFDYYFEKRNSIRRVDVLGGLENDIPRTATAIAQHGPRYVWYIRSGGHPDKEFINFLDRSLTLIDHMRFVGADVWLFENK